MPQGSVARPFKFTIYTSPLHDIASRHSLSIQIYADDNQIYIEFDLSPLSPTTAKSRLETCGVDINKWMFKNKLQLNKDKSELVVMTPSQQAGRVDIESVFPSQILLLAAP